jgi:sec-independent protein translocase protein TatC
MKSFRRGPGGEMPFLDHLEELRWRLFWSLGAVFLFTIVGFYLVQVFDVLGILTAPIEPLLGGTKLKYLNPTEPFFLTMKLALLVGIITGFPIIAYQAWAFFSPALLPAERRVIIPSLYFGLALFVVGVLFAYHLVLPMTLRFTMSFQEASLEQAIVVSEYLGMVIWLLAAFGLVFELPIVLMILSALGVVTPELLRTKRRHAIVAIAIVSSMLTPGDVASSFMMMMPLMFLYEISIFLSRLVAPRSAPAPAAAG